MLHNFSFEFIKEGMENGKWVFKLLSVRWVTSHPFESYLDVQDIENSNCA